MAQVHIGTLIHGTLHDEDLLEAFAGELERLDPEALARVLKIYPEVRGKSATVAGVDQTTIGEVLAEAIEMLIDALNEYAPPHTYFGTLEGDGSDFGFWPTGEPFNETCEVRVISRGPNGEAQFVDEDCNVYVEVSDHGNIAVFAIEPGVMARGKIGREIWSTV